MDPPFVFLSDVLNDPVDYLFHFRRKPHPGTLQYCGPHFLAFISYASKLVSENTVVTFSDRLTSLDKAAYRLVTLYKGPYCCWWWLRKTTEAQNFLNLMVAFLTQNRTEMRNFFLVPKLLQCPSKVDIIARFIDFLLDALQKLLSTRTYSCIIIPGQIDILSKRLKLLLAILPAPGTPFPDTELVERKDILAEIESIANEVGIFLYSFFFTTDHVTMTTMELELSLLLSKPEVIEEKLKEHYVTFFEQHQFTTMNLTSSSIFIVNSLLNDLDHILNHEADLIVDVKDQITKLRLELFSLCLDLYFSRSRLRDTQLQINRELTEFEIQLIDLAYQVEPIIACLVARLVPVWYLTIRLPSFIQKSELIRASLANIKLNSSIRCVQDAESSSEVSSSQVATNFPMVDDIIVGFKEMSSQIASQLIGEQDRLQIISIVGMGGLGKTTLARELYNDSNVRRHFDRRCWCIISQTYQRKKVLTDILICMPGQNKDAISKMEDHEVVDRIYKSLKMTRYLLVVDDIWEEQVWDDLKMYFPDDKNGSRILFTTRNKDVAPNSVINELSLLTDYQCWDLLHKKVFPNSPCPQALQDVGRKIANKCKGVPLRVVGIAAILANMEKKEGLWQDVATSISSYVSKDDDILELSYKHLPSHLKPCFLYLSTFKEDREIRVKILLSLWIAQGFIPTIKDKSPEDVAQDYLLELINRSMVQVAKTRSDKGVKTCAIHDLILEMCLRVAEKENFINVINDTSKKYANQQFGNFLNPFIAPSVIRLKSLKLSNYGIVYDGSTLELLVQLRHLECDGKLKNFSTHNKLEFLRLSSLSDTQTQLNMPQLRHLHFGEYLRISQAWGNALPNSLQTLSGIIVSDLNDEIRLRHFSHLRRLKCRYSINWNHCPDLSSLSQLVSLHVEGHSNGDFKSFNFPVSINKLSISTMDLTREVLLSIGRLPNLEILKMKRLKITEMRWDMSENLFMKLKFLKLWNVALREWNTLEEPFPSLEELVLIGHHQECPLPSELGYTPTLRRIELFYCSDIVKRSARKIMEEQEAEGNEQLEITGFSRS